MPGPIRVIYVDDEPALLNVGKLFLERIGEFVVTTAQSADDAISILIEQSFDVIISDYQMPRMDGIAFLKHIRSAGDTTPFIIFTGKGREDVVIQALNEGADFYLQKGGEPNSQFAELSNTIKYAVSRRRAEEALIESEERYRNVVEDQTEMISRFLPDGTHVFVNEAYCRYFELEREKILGHRFKPNIPQKDRDRVETFFASLTPDHPTDIIEHRILMPDGTVHWQRWSDRAIFNAVGDVTEYQSVGRDTTDKKEAEEALRESEDQYRTVFETTGMASVVIESDGTICLANSEFLRLCGLSKDEIENKRKWMEFVVKEDRDRMMTQHRLRRKDRDAALRNYEFRFLRSSGEMRDIYLTVDLIPGTTRSIASLLDITARKRTEDLKISEKKYRSILENIQDIYFRSDRDGNLIMASPSGAALLGYDSVDEMLGKPVALAISFDPAERAAFLADLQKTGSVSNYEVRLKKKDGTMMFASTNSHYYHDESGTVAGVEEILRDITDRKQAEEALKKEKEFHDILLELATEFITVPLAELDDVIAKKLSLIGQYAEVDRIYVFEHNHSLRITSNTYEWCAEGITPQIDNLQKIPFDLFEDLLKTLHQGDIVHIPSVQSMPEDHPTRPILAAQGIQSLILIPLMHGRENSGFVGFDAVKEHKFFSSQEISLLQLFAEILSTVFARRVAEETLRESRDYYETLLDMIHDPLQVVDHNYRLIFANEQCRIFMESIGFPVSIGENLFELCPFLPDHVILEYQNVFTTGRPVITEESTCIRGVRYHTQTTKSPVFAKDGTVSHVITIIRDVTEQKLAEEALRESEEKFHSLVSNLPGLTFRCRYDSDRTMIYMSDMIKPLSGYQAEDFIENKVLTYESIIHREDTHSVAENTHNAIKARLPWDIEYRIVHKDGSICWVHEKGQAVFDESGEVQFLDGFIHDITARKSLQTELEMDKTILEMVAEGRALSEVLEAICRACEMMDTSIRASVLLYDPKRQVLVPGAAPNLPRDYNALMEPGLPVGPDVGSCGTAAFTRRLAVAANIVSDPHWIPYDTFIEKTREHGLKACWSMPIISSTGALLGSLANYCSHTREPTPDNLHVLKWAVRIAGLVIEKKKTEEDIVRYSDELKSKTISLEELTNKLSVINQDLDERVRQRTDEISHLLTVKTDLITQIGHDLNSPLTPLIALLPIIRKKVTDPELDELLEVLIISSQRMKRIISNILSLATVEVSRAEDLQGESKVAQIADQIIKKERYFSSQNNLTLKNHLPPELLIRMNKAHCELILSNVIKNAIKYSLPSGTVIISHELSDTTFTLIVEDDGQGIEPEHLPRIFEEFYKADQSRHDNDSSGLGLSLVQRIVRSYMEERLQQQVREIGKVQSLQLPSPQNSASMYKDVMGAETPAG